MRENENVVILGNEAQLLHQLECQIIELNRWEIFTPSSMDFYSSRLLLFQSFFGFESIKLPWFKYKCVVYKFFL